MKLPVCGISIQEELLCRSGEKQDQLYLDELFKILGKIEPTRISNSLICP